MHLLQNIVLKCWMQIETASAQTYHSLKIRLTVGLELFIQTNHLKSLVMLRTCTCMLFPMNKAISTEDDTYFLSWSLCLGLIPSERDPPEENLFLRRFSGLVWYSWATNAKPA